MLKKIMNWFNEESVTIIQQSPLEIVKAIHHEFDTAGDKLLDEAKKIIELGPQLLDIPTLESTKAFRLKNLGFNNSKEVLELKELEVRKAEILKKNEEITKRHAETIEQAKLINEYKRCYPFQLFLTEDELDRICNKYGLIYAPVSNYKGEVPEKNLLEIEKCPILNSMHFPKVFYYFQAKEWYDGTPKEIVKLLTGRIKIPEEIIREITGDYKYLVANVANSWSTYYTVKLAKSLGYKSNYSSYTMYKTATIETEQRRELYIAAPRKQFTEELTVCKNSVEIHDPVVFRYCKGGIQVLTKWGLEASDPALVNDINN